MIVCFRCSRETKTKLDQLLESGQYGDYGEIISVAIANLAVLETELFEKDSLVFGTQEETTAVFQPTAPSNSQDKLAGAGSSVKLKLNALPIPPIFRLNGRLEPPSRLVELPSDRSAFPKGEVPLDSWLFGQYNRLLPAKASARALIYLLRDEPQGLSLEQAAEKIAEQAALLGDFLRVYDEQHEIGRDDLLSTAFPSSGSAGEKSRQRYASQFVGSTNREGEILGLLIGLKLINKTNREGTLVCLTEPGWRFASMTNPVLDGAQEVPTQKFSDEEIDFLLRHIVQHVPVEDFAYRAILGAMMDGANTPDTIDAALKRYVPRSRKNDLSESYISTQRSGAISRMTDLGLVERVRDGVRVQYEVTKAGSEFVKRARQGS